MLLEAMQAWNDFQFTTMFVLSFVDAAVCRKSPIFPPSKMFTCLSSDEKVLCCFHRQCSEKNQLEIDSENDLQWLMKFSFHINA